MARTSLTPKAAPGSYPTVAADSLDLAMAAADVANMNQFAASGNDVIFIHNTGGSPYTVTITSAVDPYNRTQDITTYSVGAGEYAVIGPLKLPGWVQTDGKVYLQASNASVKFGIVAI